jgi:hypothetical protein
VDEVYEGLVEYIRTGDMNANLTVEELAGVK